MPFSLRRPRPGIRGTQVCTHSGVGARGKDPQTRRAARPSPAAGKGFLSWQLPRVGDCVRFVPGVKDRGERGGSDKPVSTRLHRCTSASAARPPLQAARSPSQALGVPDHPSPGRSSSQTTRLPAWFPQGKGRGKTNLEGRDDPAAASPQTCSNGGSRRIRWAGESYLNTRASRPRLRPAQRSTRARPRRRHHSPRGERWGREQPARKRMRRRSSVDDG